MATFTQAFQLSALGTPTAGEIQIALNTVSTIAPRIVPYVFGMATEGFDHPGGNQYLAAINTNFQAQWRTQQPRLLRHNCPATNDNFWGTGNGARANWLSGSASFFRFEGQPTSDFTNKDRQTFTTGNFVTGGAGPPTIPQLQATANWFKSNGIECFYWEIFNEADFWLSTTDWVNSYFTPARNALKTINANYQVGGPCTGANAYNNTWNVAAINAGADFLSWHQYPGNPTISDPATLFATANNRAADMADFVSKHGQMTVFLSEYNIDSSSANPVMQQTDGAVWTSCYLASQLLVTGNRIEMAALWTIPTNGNMTAIEEVGTMRVNGWLLTKLGRTMGGTRVTVTKGSGLGSIHAIASTTPGTWAVWLTNFNAANGTTQVNITGLTGTNCQLWELSTRTGTTPSVTTVTVASLSTLKVPNRGVMVISSAAT